MTEIKMHSLLKQNQKNNKFNRSLISKLVRSALLLPVIATMASSVYAEGVDDFVSSEDKKFTYQPQFFARYAPQTATDMVLQIPGFKLEGTNQNGQNNQVRGLGQGTGNLLLNGKRASTKDNSPLDLLARIPAENISYIEILTQGSTELSGQSGQIVNVVYQEPNQVNGYWTASMNTQEEGVTTGGFEGSVAGKYNNIGYTVSFDRFNNEFPQWGEEQAFDENGDVWEVRDEYSSFTNHGLNLSLGLNWEGQNEQIVNVNLSSSDVSSRFFENSDRYQPSINSADNLGDLVSNVDFISDGQQDSYEIGADYSRALGFGTWKLIGLRRYEENLRENYFDDMPVSDDSYAFRSKSKPKETESVIRTLYSFQPEVGHNVDIALEGVVNNLKTSTVFEENVGAGFEILAVDGSNLEVNEDRAEFSVQYSRPLSDVWSMQSLIATEYSKISVTSDSAETADRSESFQRYKGFLAINGKISEDSTLRARLERSVGQLSFGEFASSRNANEGTSDGGNTELVPDQTWRAEVSYEYTFGEIDILTLTAFTEHVDDFITFIPFDDGTEGRGNIDKLTRHGIEISTTIALDRFGLEGMKLDLSGEFRDSTITDPVTGGEINYTQNGYNRVHYQANFRHDIPGTAMAWGIVVEERSGNERYRLNQVSTNRHRWPQAHKLFFEHKDIFGMTLKMETEDMFGFTWKNSRTFYDGDRNGDITGQEKNRRHSPWMLRMSLNGNF